MLQLSADFNLPSLPAGSILAASSKGKGGAFVDLLGLALEGQLGALQTGSKAQTAGDAALSTAEAAPGQAGDLLAALGMPADPARPELAALLLAGQATPRNTQAERAPAMAGDGEAQTGTTSLLGIALDPQRTKLPAGPAELAAVPAKPVLPLTAQDPTAALKSRATSASVADTSLDAGPDKQEALAEILGATVKNSPRAAPPAVPTSPPTGNAEIANAGAAALQAAQARPAGEADTAAATSPVSLRIMAPLGGAEWRAEIGDRVAWMVGRGAQSAELVLNPPALGTIEVKLNMNMAGNEAGAQFFAANASVRDALEASFPRLRELLASAGINLGDASLTSQSFADARQEGQGGSGSAAHGAESNPTSLAERIQTGSGRLPGLVDLYI